MELVAAIEHPDAMLHESFASHYPFFLTTTEFTKD